MPGLGGMNPFPRKLGGGRSRAKVILDGLNADRGTAVDATNRETAVYALNVALARGIAGAWATNQRLANMWSPDRMASDVLARWEKILSILPAPEDDEVTRRARVRAIFQRFGKAATISNVTSALDVALGDAFVAVEHIPYGSAQIFVPDGTYPFGTVGPVPWASNLAHVLIRMQKPAGWTEGDFYEAAAKVALVLDPMLPVWSTFAWYRPGAVSTPIAGGPSAAGFYLDQPSNLDNQILLS